MNEEGHRYFFGLLPEMPWKKKSSNFGNPDGSIICPVCGGSGNDGEPRSHEIYCVACQSQGYVYPNLPHNHFWRWAHLADDSEGYKCAICGKEQHEIDEDLHGNI